MPVYAITYRYTDDSAGRDVHRPAHKEFLGALGKQGTLRVSGPFGPDDTPGALIIVRAESREEAAAVTADDPFQVNGLVATVSVQEWVPMMGSLAGEF